MMQRIWIPVLSAVLVVSCMGLDQPEDAMRDEEMAFAEAESAPGMMVAKAPASPPAEAPRRSRMESAQPSVPVPQERKIIRHGNMSIEVESVEDALELIKRWVDSMEGYVTNESMSEDGYSRKTGSITCRIPTGELDGAMERLKGLGKVEDVSVSADDITDQYYDLQIRMENQKQLEKRLLELLNRQTNKLSDLLEVERELARVRTQIDSMEGRKRLWDNQVAYSTLYVNVYEPMPTIAGDDGGAFRTLMRSFGEAANNFVLMIAGIIAASGAIIPLIAVFVFVIWLMLKVWRRRKRKAEATAGSDNA
jgi:hypothetical protein